jgi:hypothetical protein
VTILVDDVELIPSWLLDERANDMPITYACEMIVEALKSAGRCVTRVTAHDTIAGPLESDALNGGDYDATVGDVILLDIKTESMAALSANLERDVTELLALAVVHCRAAAKAARADDEDAATIVMDAMESTQAILRGVSALQLLRDLEPAKLLDAETITEAVETIERAETPEAIAEACETIAEVLNTWAS